MKSVTYEVRAMTTDQLSNEYRLIRICPDGREDVISSADDDHNKVDFGQDAVDEFNKLANDLATKDELIQELEMSVDFLRKESMAWLMWVARVIDKIDPAMLTPIGEREDPTARFKTYMDRISDELKVER